MAQHYPLSRGKEPRLYVKLTIITRRLKRYWDNMKDFDGRIIETKEVQRLPKQYYSKGKAFSVGSFLLQDHRWHLRMRAKSIEVHVDHNWNIRGVYYVL